MAELGITPASRSRVATYAAAEANKPVEFRILFGKPDGSVCDYDGNPVLDAGRDSAIKRGNM